MQKYLSWVEISKDALTHNIGELKKRVGDKPLVCPCVKANAYGHGLVQASLAFVEAGANWLAVNALYEAEELRAAGVNCPIYIMGYTLLSDLKKACEGGFRLVVYNRETIAELGKIAASLPGEKLPVNVHIKVETGNNRQGVLIPELVDFAKYVVGFPGLRIEGLATHFANIEDTTNHDFAFEQVKRFSGAKALLAEAGIDVSMMHCSNSAATILFPEVHFDMVRIGISAYGMWPSNETFVSYKNMGTGGLDLRPALTWKSVIGQIKTVGSGEFVGYGCTYRTTRDLKMAIIPVGYYDGYDRGLSNSAHVLVRGQRARIVGRVCMNIIMADVTDIPDVCLEDEVVLLGAQGDDIISAEQFATWASTINYEVTTRINERIPRIVI